MFKATYESAVFFRRGGARAVDPGERVGAAPVDRDVALVPAVCVRVGDRRAGELGVGLVDVDARDRRIGAVAGRVRDTGIKNPKLKEVADQLEPGKAAVIALVEESSTLAAQNALVGYEGSLVIQALDEETVKELYKAAHPAQ